MPEGFCPAGKAIVQRDDVVARLKEGEDAAGVSAKKRMALAIAGSWHRHVGIAHPTNEIHYSEGWETRSWVHADWELTQPESMTATTRPSPRSRYVQETIQAGILINSTPRNESTSHPVQGWQLQKWISSRGKGREPRDSEGRPLRHDRHDHRHHGHARHVRTTAGD